MTSTGPRRPPPPHGRPAAPARLDTSVPAANPEAFDLTADGDLHVVRRGGRRWR
ncbi:hypothetical protein [Streptomyces parvulus]|uniref:hypothetical protein n=1 Tax=Streptomyces parvulus TaxID=146923 RepID=UPI003EBC8DC8